MKEQGIIEKVDGATPWLSPMIAIPKKSGDVRLVLDMRIPNTALIRRRVQMPTVDEILQKMQGAKIFTEVDLSQGYLQITLAEESRFITAFPTPDDGPHRFKRLIMGACPSGEYFHEEIHELIRDIPSCANISDNIWLWSEDRQSHLQQLDKLLTTLENSGITLKLPKCSFAVPKINVFGHIVSANGIQPDEAKVEAVNNAPPPKSASEVRSFLGLTNYCSRYIADYSSITHPLRQLTRAETTFAWKEEHEQAFQQLKQALTSSPVLAHYSLTAPTRVVVDASPWAVGAVLLQQQEDDSYRPIAYGSRALSETEAKYAQIEKESLAIVFGCEHFHMYVYGRSFELETDHRPLEHIYKAKASNPGKPPPARIERWKLRLQEYDFKVVYRPGANNLADSLSRLPTPTPRSNMEACADRYVHYLARELTPQAMDLTEVERASANDPELREVRECIARNQLHKLPAPYRQIAGEISITAEDVVLRGNRIVLPTELRARAIVLAHEDHAGMTRCKQRLRSKLWWPHMDKEVENHIQSCHPCQVTARPPRPEPVQPTDLPQERWTHLAIDVCGPFPTGESVVVLTDYYSRWPEVKILKSVTSTTVLRWLDSVFAVHGYPQQIKSDNASYFVSREFRDTLKSWGVEFKTVTEYWPQANGQVERFNEVLEKHVQTSRVDGKDWRHSIPTMLRNYRSTPHRMTGHTPAMLLLQRELRTKLPSLQTEEAPSNAKVRAADAKAKQKAKEYADCRRNARPRNLKVGDWVLVKQKHRDKYSTTFHPDPAKILQINGNQIILETRDGRRQRRNSSHIRLYRGTVIPPEEEELDDDTMTTHAAQPGTNQVPNSVQTPVPVVEQARDEQPRRSGRTRKRPEHLKDFV